MDDRPLLADKVVYSSTLEDVSTARTRIERQFEPEAMRQLKDASEADLSIGGAALGAEAFRHGLVDECVLLLCPVLVGGGKPALPRGVRLELLDHMPTTAELGRGTAAYCGWHLQDQMLFASGAAGEIVTTSRMQGGAKWKYQLEVAGSTR